MVVQDQPASLGPHGETLRALAEGGPLSVRVELGGSARPGREGDAFSNLAKSFGHGRAHAHWISCCPAGTGPRSVLLVRQKEPLYEKVTSSETVISLLVRSITSSRVLAVSRWSVSQLGVQL